MQTETQKLYTQLQKQSNLEVATFAGGCFWCLQGPFESHDGVIKTFSGYAGGILPSPTYMQVNEGKTGHKEANQIYFDPNKITFEQILNVFWSQIDPTDPGGQFADRGTQYQTAIFYHDDIQKTIAQKSKETLGISGRYEKPIVTEIIPFTTFYLAEDEHQDYFKKHILHYKQYHYFSGRGKYIEEMENKYGK